LAGQSQVYFTEESEKNYPVKNKDNLYSMATSSIGDTPSDTAGHGVIDNSQLLNGEKLLQGSTLLALRYTDLIRVVDPG
jgi:hypothetical protein